MKRFSLKIVSVLLAVVLIAAPILSISAFAAEKIAAKNFPLIEIHGFYSSTIYADKNDKNSKEIAPWPTDEILTAVKECIPALASFAVTKDYDALGDAVVPAAKKLFEPSFCEPDGTAKGESGPYFKYPKAEQINKHSTLSFKYDWRIDPFEIASQLNDFIDYVLEASDCDKVALSCHSLGGVVTLTYLSVYGNSKIYGVAFNTTAIFGEAYTGQLFSGNIEIIADALINYLKYAFEYGEYQELLNSILDILAKAGLTDMIAELGNNIVEHLLIRTIPEVLMPLFCTWLTLWAMCPDEYVADAMNFMFKYADPNVDYSQLKEKIVKYNTEVRANKVQTLKDLDEVARVAVISRYGYSSIPLTSDWTNMSDGVVDSAYSSFGATTAPYGETFSKEYLDKVDPEFISPDKTVDTSTCLFPEKTWMVKGFKHAENSRDLDDMIDALLYHPKKEATVDTYDQYPRFLKYEPLTDGLVIDNNQQTKSSLIKEFFKNLVAFFEKIINFFYKLGK